MQGYYQCIFAGFRPIFRNCQKNGIGKISYQNHCFFYFLPNQSCCIFQAKWCGTQSKKFVTMKPLLLRSGKFSYKFRLFFNPIFIVLFFYLYFFLLFQAWVQDALWQHPWRPFIFFTIICLCKNKSSIEQINPISQN